jgi:hypothetical protein
VEELRRLRTYHILLRTINANVGGFVQRETRRQQRFSIVFSTQCFGVQKTERHFKHITLVFLSIADEFPQISTRRKRKSDTGNPISLLTHGVPNSGRAGERNLEASGFDGESGLVLNLQYEEI